MSYGADVESVIEYVGEPLVLRKFSDGVFDNDLGKYTTASTSSDSGFMGRITRFDKGLVNGTTIMFGDLEVIAVGFDGTSVPSPGDQMLRDSRVYSVISVDAESISGEVMFYRLQVRGV